MKFPYPWQRTRVKICGFTRPEDAAHAVALGVDAVGLVFCETSPRNVSIGQAEAIVTAVPPFTAVVGLFVDAESHRIREVCQRVRVDVLQFHGDEPPDFCTSFAKPYVKAIRMTPEVDVEREARIHNSAVGLLLDTYHPGVKGGTGLRFDWTRIGSGCSLPLILAGGLTPDNVREALERVGPYAVDVSSGVEADKGIKDSRKMAAFIRKIYDFDHERRNKFI
jgi:phosphoribosylanthranilate isomerase